MKAWREVPLFWKSDLKAMEKPSYTVRVMTEEDVPQTLDVWRSTGMQEGTHCLYTWLKVDPEAFQIAVTDSERDAGFGHDSLAMDSEGTHNDSPVGQETQTLSKYFSIIYKVNKKSVSDIV
ncbi:uncharacterized protein TNCT_424881 [Trichonephila clavata]|uniref:Uncharacterized protein n=1 Tax=Trichonephila clavata TaxID=2740835 RepID=A0A8X6JEL0_TRICU|nr:uncharacterized protein TNCT_424881 [Trichonephila clavata]